MGDTQVGLVLSVSSSSHQNKFIKGLYVSISVLSKGNVVGKKLDMIPQEAYVLMEKRLNF